jgi:mRNA-degrading endonuclease YafQ of YafQ-DinJ toxin-antitoxin module
LIVYSVPNLAKKHLARSYKKLTKDIKTLAIKVQLTIKKLSKGPFDESLRAHKVDSLHFGIAYYSRVTGDIRIIWNFDEMESTIILFLTIGVHSGGGKGY